MSTDGSRTGNGRSTGGDRAQIQPAGEKSSPSSTDTILVTIPAGLSGESRTEYHRPVGSPTDHFKAKEHKVDGGLTELFSNTLNEFQPSLDDLAEALVAIYRVVRLERAAVALPAVQILEAPSAIRIGQALS
ncbi:hypothetical protein N7G274_005237 [Stereocaulon virgatum]|uniref:Uncharacterized protein n=1 Tax=Stereocaulon virgatum TaxID=373712 RepID=A0ABR4ABG1_9LECA